MMKHYSKLLTLLLVVIGLNSHAQTFFDMKAEYTAVYSSNNCSPYCNPNADFTKIVKVKEDEAMAAFNYLSKKSGIQFNYPQGGCPERALIMHYILDSMGITDFRIWVFAPLRVTSGDSRNLYINDKNKLIDDASNQIHWPFHVAPCVLTITPQGGTDTIVFDPAINPNKPLNYHEWLNAIGNHEVAKYTFLDSRFYQFNLTNTGLVNGYFYPYEGGAFDDKWLEKTLAMNDVAITLYNKYIVNAEANKVSATKKALVKTLLGNSATFYAILNRNDGLPAYSKLNTLIKSNPALIKEIWTLHDTRFSYWLLRVTNLYK